MLIGADTAVVLRGRILGKPRDAGEAVAMLRELTGTSHSVITGCVLLPVDTDTPDIRLAHCFSVESRVRMWDCPEPLLHAYVRGGEPMDKAGAYAVQGTGAFLVQEIEGSWSNVVGLPLAELIQQLLAMKAIAGR